MANEVGLDELTPAKVQVLWARLLDDWEYQLNSEVTMGPGGDFQWSMQMLRAVEIRDECVVVSRSDGETISAPFAP